MLKYATGLLRLRYLFLGGAVSGGYGLTKKYEQFRDGLPEIPEVPEYIKALWTDWNFLKEINNTLPKTETLVEVVNTRFKSVVNDDDTFDKSKAEKEARKSRSELISIRKELDRVKKENRELRSAIRSSPNQMKRKLKKSLIEMYSEVLDELSGYDSCYKIQDHLPKVVVVGDQSSGKTSVLEMIAGARIFPRGGGEMMTRAPVQVTLSEGLYHVARFKDNPREFDLTKESELAQLREEIENRMRQSIQNGKTVSNQVISLTIQGPGIQRMVLVDLPGIIGTVTSELAPDTKECIKSMVTEYMGNPNAIILCIQDGSLDAERSIFTDLVQEVDKKGERTILVLTKVDLAEKNRSNPTKIKKILDGKLFPMKALGYYAVVAGKSGENEDIQQIKDYEEHFFSTSSLIEQGILNPDQCSTRNLSTKVSECFWGMVKSSIEQQSDTYRATKINLEAEWKYLFPLMRQYTRDELFHNAKNEVLNEVAEISRLSKKHWDQFISTQLWQRVKDHIVNQIYFPAASDPMHFHAKVDIELQRWVSSFDLPKLAVQVAQDSLKYQFDKLLESDSTERNQQKNSKKDESEIYQDLKKAVIDEALQRHKWRPKALDVLRYIQQEALSKETDMTKENWEKAINFLKENLTDLMNQTKYELTTMTGCGAFDRWVKWKSLTSEQTQNQLIEAELKKVLQNDMLSMSFKSKLGESDLNFVRKNLEAKGIEHVSDEQLLKLWEPLVKINFLEKEVNRASYCSKLFYFYENDIDSGIDCNHVIFFSRIKLMLESTARSLRRQILEDECKRFEKEVVEVLDEYSDDPAIKAKHLFGKRVELAEELKTVTKIQEKLEEFITALNQEGR